MGAALFLTEVQHTHDAGVLELGENLGLANEASGAVWPMVDVGKNTFDDHRFGKAGGPLEAAEIHDPHAALRQ
ncbi:MAG: hypothetical protein ABI895_23385 [Deltaproteobacteria bacterium]